MAREDEEEQRRVKAVTGEARRGDRGEARRLEVGGRLGLGMGAVYINLVGTWAGGPNGSCLAGKFGFVACANWPNRTLPRGRLSAKKNFIKIIIKNSK
jgi:hypothetical protein